MRQKFVTLSVISLSVAIVGCDNGNIENTIEYNLNNAERGSISDSYVDVEVVPLEFDGNYSPKGVSDLQVTDSVIFIRDNHNSLYVYSSDGLFMGCSDTKIGQGPEEFSVVMGATINNDESTLEILTPDKLITCDITFNQISFAELPTRLGKDGLIFSQIYKLSESTYILLPTKTSRNSNSTYLFNYKTSELNKGQSFDNEIIVDFSMQGYNFFCQKDGKVMFVPHGFTEYVYSIDNESGHIERSVHLISNNNFITSSDIASLGNSREQQASRIFSTGKEIPLKIQISPNHIFVLTTKGPTIHDMKYYVVSRAYGKVKSINLYDGDSQIYPYVNFIDDDYAYSIIEKDVLETHTGLLLTESNYDWLDEMESETLVLLKYRFRN